MIQEEFKSTEDEFVVNQAGLGVEPGFQDLVASNSPSVEGIEDMRRLFSSGGGFNPPVCWADGCWAISHRSWVNEPQRGATTSPRGWGDGAACKAGKIDAKKRLERDIDPGTEKGAERLPMVNPSIATPGFPLKLSSLSFRNSI